MTARARPGLKNLYLRTCIRTSATAGNSSKYDELAEYDGSDIAERPKGELAARCDMEEANLLALNLAHKIVTGAWTVLEEQQFYAAAMRDQKHVEYLQGLRFQVPRTPQGDLDQEVLAQR
ncbi:MAG: hypothetical protein ACRERE_32080 [Candidatus Entotheonellia bacterium]